jgi:xylulokinase
MKLVLGVDLGTSYFKLGLFDRSGDLRGLAKVKVIKERGDGSLCEISAERFWLLLCQGLQQACRMAGARLECIEALSYASQANSFILLQADGNPLTPIILWSDQRSAGLDGVQALFRHRDFLQQTGLGLECHHQFCVAKLLWLQTQRPEIWSRAAYLLTLSDYFTFALTGQLVGDCGTASLLGLLNVHTLEWLPHIIDLGQAQLVTPQRPGTVAGVLSHHGAALLGVRPAIPLVLGSLDHHLAGMGAGLNQIAEMCESTGTVLACLKSDSIFNPQPQVCVGAGMGEGQFYQLVFDDNGASGLEWYQQVHAAGLTFVELEQMARLAGIGSDGLTARPMACQYDALQGFLQQSALHHHGHFFRSLLESTAASLVKLVRLLSADHTPQRIVATGGGAASDLWLQIKADLLGVEYIATATHTPACLGAAMLAAIALGWFTDLDRASAKWIHIRKTFKPDSSNHQKYLAWYRTLEQAGWACHQPRSF